MLKTVTIKNFRNFPYFELQNLGRLNLLVGTNNSGKTSVLEAIRLLCSQNDLQPLIDATRSRGEYFYDDHKTERELDIRHLFHNHKIEPSDQFSVSGLHENGREEIRASIGVHEKDEQLKLDYGEEFPSSSQDNLLDSGLDDFQILNFTLEWISGKEHKYWKHPLSSNGGLSYDYLRRVKALPRTKVQFITSAALTTSEMVRLFDQVVLTDEEDLVVEALQTIEPRIIRIAPLSSERYKYSEAREGFMIRFRDSNQRIPIGSMGDGIWRILGLALATVDAANGVLLVDEIDTGLHFTAMSDMWKLVWETAKRLNVQVFATTHSNDCWTSLATIANRKDTTEDGITIQRIEKNKEIGVAFSEEEIVTAANRGIEVR